MTTIIIGITLIIFGAALVYVGVPELKEELKNGYSFI